MKKAGLITYYVPYTDADFKNLAGFIIDCLENNPHFPDPIPTLESIRVLYEAYKGALINAGSMDRLAVAVKNEYRKQLAHELARLALYVMYIADGNELILVSSGYPLTKKPKSISITNPGLVTIKNGQSTGELTASVKAVKGARSYIFEIATDEFTPESQWKSIPWSSRSYTFTKLKPGNLYFMRVMAVGSGGQKTYSPVRQQYSQ